MAKLVFKGCGWFQRKCEIKEFKIQNLSFSNDSTSEVKRDYKCKWIAI